MIVQKGGCVSACMCEVLVHSCTSVFLLHPEESSLPRLVCMRKLDALFHPCKEKDPSALVAIARQLSRAPIEIYS